jgi:hypothetical protein
MFEPDNIKDGESLRTLKELGGVPALEDYLKTNFKVDISPLFPLNNSLTMAF